MSSWRRSSAVGMALFAAVVLVSRSAGAETISLDELRRSTHIHGLAVDRQDSTRLFVATHHGLFVVGKDGMATRVGVSRDDFMGFTPHPNDSKTLFASGHPFGGGNLGFIISRDGGASWQPLSPGVKGPVDFHLMDISKADPNTIYGVYSGLQVSRDAGRSWTMVGPVPSESSALAASARNVDTLFVATRNGLVVSKDGGRSWADAYFARKPTSLVHVHDGGAIFAFVVGVGLITADEETLRWSTLSNAFGERVLLHLAVDPSDRTRLYAATQQGELLASSDGGRTWRALSGIDASKSGQAPSQ